MGREGGKLLLQAAVRAYKRDDHVSHSRDDHVDKVIDISHEYRIRLTFRGGFSLFISQVDGHSQN